MNKLQQSHSSTAGMKMRSRFSSWMAAPLVKRLQHCRARGTAFSVPFSIWRLVPSAVKAWLSYRVLSQAEASAKKSVQSHNVLGKFNYDENNRWALTPSSLLYLWNLLNLTRPTRIVEFGSGLSTRLFAEYAQQMKVAGTSVHILSIEHDEFWLGQLRETLSNINLLDGVELCYAPLSNQRLLGRNLDAYTVDSKVLSHSAGNDGFQLCLIDGPPGSTGRVGCLPLVSNYLAPRATILLDDALRFEEQSVCREWKAAWGKKFSSPRLQLLDQHGMMHAIWKGPALLSQNQQQAGDSSLVNNVSTATF